MIAAVFHYVYKTNELARRWYGNNTMETDVLHITKSGNKVMTYMNGNIPKTVRRFMETAQKVETSETDDKYISKFYSNHTM